MYSSMMKLLPRRNILPLRIYIFFLSSRSTLIALFPDLLDSAVSSYIHITGHPPPLDEPIDDFLYQEPFSANYSLTRGVRPVACHSHNDYWRPYPLYSAIHAGCIGVEADIWLYENDLYVGHTTSTLRPNRTFDNLYVNPLVEILDARNPQRQQQQQQQQQHSGQENREPPNGVFTEAPHQTLVLLVDFKMNGDETWPYLMKQLDPLRERGYLTYFNGTTRVEGPVTVVGTGNAPFHLIVENSTYRDVFYDAPLAYLPLLPDIDETQTQSSSSDDQNSTTSSSLSTKPPPLPPFDFTNSYYASASFKKFIGTCWAWMLTNSQLDTIRLHVNSAHKRGLFVRYWSSPGFPHGFRNRLWRLMIQEGVDLLNTDDLVAATSRDWGWKGKWAWVRKDDDDATGMGFVEGA
ncbi:PLC-like phosphodiesterase, TIM beta/alpha-barrel domain protein [Ascosphaera apis ARSEF 7405]|uniref:Altered inheritance of mitochondria protein 6 n=1 Tax=Ascosphaera apis ARSEF 7405 TaxID=392613 RepID=A0A167VJG6_9EURO|nr:PLC-like phosphodiesterase, TIM beta/alpha-barrel domain protein [Ascosphaera apis ARSEF 7405]